MPFLVLVLGPTAFLFLVRTQHRGGQGGSDCSTVVGGKRVMAVACWPVRGRRGGQQGCGVVTGDVATAAANFDGLRCLN